VVVTRILRSAANAEGTVMTSAAAARSKALRNRQGRLSFMFKVAAQPTDGRYQRS